MVARCHSDSLEAHAAACASALSRDGTPACHSPAAGYHPPSPPVALEVEHESGSDSTIPRGRARAIVAPFFDHEGVTARTV
jgi:hypothetical protein